MIKTPRQRTLAVRDLRVDQYVQRTYNEGDAERIAKEWNQDKIGVFKVSKRADGGHYVFDGQHRLGALRLQGRLDDKVEALVYEGLTVEQEAFLFLADNADNRKPTPVDVFRLSVVAGDQAAIEINEVVQKHGLRIGYGGDHRTVAAVASLRWIHEHGGTDLLDRTLTIVEAAWPPHREAKDGQLIKGLAYFLLKAHGASVNTDSLIFKMGAEGTSTQLIGRARTYKPVTGRALWMEVAHTIAAVYNKGRTTNRVTL